MLIVETEINPLIYNTLQFDQYSRLAILLNIFWFSAKNIWFTLKILKTNLKLEKKTFH